MILFFLHISGKQTVDRLSEFIEEKQTISNTFFNDIQPDISRSQVEEHVIRNVRDSKDSNKKKKSESDKIADLRERVLEEDETLFLVIHDEAHSAPVKDNLVDQFINDETIKALENVIVVQVSATPYCLVTENTHIPNENRLNWFTKEEEKSKQYYGIQQFIDRDPKDPNDPTIPGAMTSDYEFESCLLYTSDAADE